MDISYKRIDAALAKEFTDYILPVVAEDKAFNDYMFYALLDEGHLIGLLVADPRRIGPEILSIAIAPSYQKRGLAPDLLAFALEDMVTMYDGSEGINPNYFGATLIAEPRQLAKLGNIFQSCGFKRDVEGSFYETTIGAIRKSAILNNKNIVEQLGSKEGQKKYKSLQNIPEQRIRSFGSQLNRENVVPGIDINDIEKDISFVELDGDNITAAILFFKENNKTLQNCLLYRKTKTKAASDLFCLFTASANAASTLYPSDIKISFFAENETVEKIILKVFPKAEVSQKMVTYMLPFNAALYKESL